jgi:hypothetical protein
MPGTMREGKMRSKLREAILAGFNPASLDLVLHDNDMFRPNVAIGPDFTTRVNSLIDVARQEGWLIELCGVLAAARAENAPVNSSIVGVQKWLIDQRDTDEIDLEFQQNFDLPSKLNKNDGSRFLRLFSVMVAVVALVGITAWIFAGKAERTQQPSISTSGPQSPVVQGTKGDVQINLGSPPPAAPK